jgi:hypothetical protein
MTKRFQRRREDFTCENCGREVKGDGYTNHCPACLFSKHVDIMPGDRSSPCGGLMTPSAIEMTGGKYFIVHVCQACGHKKRNGLGKHDDFQVVTAIAKAYALASRSRSP